MEGPWSRQHLMWFIVAYRIYTEAFRSSGQIHRNQVTRIRALSSWVSTFNLPVHLPDKKTKKLNHLASTLMCWQHHPLASMSKSRGTLHTPPCAHCVSAPARTTTEHRQTQRIYQRVSKSSFAAGRVRGCTRQQTRFHRYHCRHRTHEPLNIDVEKVHCRQSAVVIRGAGRCLRSSGLGTMNPSCASARGPVRISASARHREIEMFVVAVRASPHAQRHLCSRLPPDHHAARSAETEAG